MTTVITCRTHQSEEVERFGLIECWECVVEEAEKASLAGHDLEFAKSFAELGFYLVPSFSGTDLLDKYLSDCLTIWYVQVRYSSGKPYSVSVEQTSLAPGDIYSDVERSLRAEEFKKAEVEFDEEFLFIRPCETLTNAIILQEYLAEELGLVREN